MQRKFSLASDFMNLKADDLVLGYLQHFATYHPEKKMLYIPLEKVNKEKPIMAEMFDCSTRTISRKITILVELGLIQSITLVLNGKTAKVYEFPQNTIDRYQMIDDDFMWYITQTRRSGALKLYLYLANKWIWKKKQGELYSFTAGELALALGYSTASARQGTIINMINTLLESFKREGAIDYVEYYYNNLPYKRLTKLCTKLNELPT